MHKNHLLVHVHLYYPELIQDILDCLINLASTDYDLYVTEVIQCDAENEQIKELKPEAHFLIVKNKGYDMGPFFEVLKAVDLDNYNLVVKIHTKRDFPYYFTINGHNVTGPLWRQRLLSIIRNNKKLLRSLKEFETNPSLGMVGSGDLIFSIKQNSAAQYHKQIYFAARELLSMLNIKPHPENFLRFVAGSMFITRSCILKKIQLLNLNIEDFSVPDRKNELDLAHICEYFLGLLVTSTEYSENKYYKIYDPGYNKIYFLINYPLRYRFVRKFLRFICRIEYTKDFSEKQIRILKFFKLRLK